MRLDQEMACCFCPDVAHVVICIWTCLVRAAAVGKIELYLPLTRPKSAGYCHTVSDVFQNKGNGEAKKHSPKRELFQAAGYL